MRVYLKNLDGIRFLAAAMVILEHSSEYKHVIGPGLPDHFGRFFRDLGSYGVTLFFVLSGYLIFYLLFRENEFKGTISIRNFYIRRMLRIWPLYLGFGLVLVLGIDYFFSRMGLSLSTPVAENLFYLLTFSINFQILFALPNRGIIELYWSVCIEEQFYLFAPWLVKKGKRIILPLILALIFTGVASIFILHWLIQQYHWQFNGHNLLYFFTVCRFDNFGLGALAAYIYFNKNVFARLQPYIANPYLQTGVILFTALYVLHVIPQPVFVQTYLFSTLPAILFAYIVLAASSGKFILNLELPLFRTLGKYSYGIYVYHAVLSEMILIFLNRNFPSGGLLLYDLVYPLLCIAVTALVAGLSYEFYEKRFMQLKEKYSVLKSRPI